MPKSPNIRMNIHILIAIGCVFGLTTGQLLMKISANHFASDSSYFSPKGLLILFAALTLYAGQTLAWVWALKTEELGKLYPIFGFAFILVPFFSYVFLHEKFTATYWIGAILITTGVIVSTKSGYH